jgi:hypothetical protein
MAKLTFGQEAIQNIINQGRIEAGITNIIVFGFTQSKLE